MSLRIMNYVWETDCANHTRKLVMLALADNANDQGVCWPSIATIAIKCSMSERAITKHVRELEADGLLNVDRIVGRGSKYYLKFQTPAPRAPLNGVHHTPEPRAGVPLHRVHHTPARRAPLYITTKEPSVEPPPNPWAAAVEEFVSAWNTTTPFPTIRNMSAGRMVHFKERMKEKFFVENWKQAMERITKSAFCCGENARGWIADVEFFLRRDTVSKIMEGKYDNENKNGKRQTDGKNSKQRVDRNKGTLNEQNPTDYSALAVQSYRGL